MNSKLIGENGVLNFEDTGVCVLESIFSFDDLQKIRNNCDDALIGAEKGSKLLAVADGVTKNEQFWPLLTNEKINRVLRRLIPGKLVYTQHSDLHKNLGTGAFHRDAREKKFDQDYKYTDEIVLRLALYVPDKQGNMGGLLVIPGTHKKQSQLQSIEINLHNNIRRRIFRKFNLNELYPQFSLFSNCVKLRPKAGSVVIFDQRVLHAGMLPKDIKGDKYSVFWSFGSDSKGTKDHILFYRNKNDYLNSIPVKLKNYLQSNSILTY